MYNDDDLIIAFIASDDGCILAIHSGYETFRDAQNDASSRPNRLSGYDGAWIPMRRWELDYY